MAFEETAEELAQNVRSLGFDLDDLVEQKKLLVDYVHVERSEIEETGEYDLEGLFIRLGHAIDSIGAKRVVLDTIETLFGGLSNAAILRAELRRLFRWLKDKGVTAIITGERGDGTLTRHGLEEYVSDCVILLDHRVTEQLSTRRLRIVKYRGTAHGTNEYPFLIDEDGISVLPITSLGLQHEASRRADLHRRSPARRHARRRGLLPRQQRAHLRHGGHRQDQPRRPLRRRRLPARRALPVLRLRGVARARSSATCAPSAWTWSRGSKKGLLRFHASRPTLYGLEMHLATIHKLVSEFQPRVVIVDPITNFTRGGHVRRGRGDADAADRLPQGPADHRPVHQPDPRRRRPGAEPRSASRRSSTPGCCCATSSWAASATAGCTSSSRAAWPTPTRSASSC